MDFRCPGKEIVLRVMDGDTVEEKNLARQPFVPEDIGQNKASVLAAVAEECLSLTNVRAYPYYLSPETMDYLYIQEDFFKKDRGEKVQILIGCVDNHAARKLLHDYFQEAKNSCWANLFYIDSANESVTGEIVIGKITKGKMKAPDRVHYYPDIFQNPGKAAYELSCEERAAVAPQQPATNGLAADLMFSYISQILRADESYIMEASAGIVYFNAAKLFSRFDIFSRKEEKNGKNDI